MVAKRIPRESASAKHDRLNWQIAKIEQIIGEFTKQLRQLLADREAFETSTPGYENEEWWRSSNYFLEQN